MIIFTDKSKSDLQLPNSLTYNLNSYSSNYDYSASNLMPSYDLLDRLQNRIDAIESQEFDNAYAEELLRDRSKLMVLLNILSDSASNKNIIILIENSQFRTAIAESLIKFIKCRYGYDCYIVNEVEDIAYIMERDPSDFSIDGVFNFDDDYQRVIVSNQEYFNALESSIENAGG